MNELHPSIVALVSMAANIATNHPKQGLCQVDRLKQYGVTRTQLDEVVEIARHLGDETAQSLDASFDAALAERFTPKAPDPLSAIAIATAPSGKSCC